MRKPRLPLPILAVCAILTVSAPAAAQTIGVVAPLSDSFALLGGQIRAGAEVAAAERRIAEANIRFVDDSCSAEGGEKAAGAMVAAGVRIVVGFLCSEAIEAAMPILKGANIPVVTPGVRANSLTDQRAKTGWPVYRMAPRADGEREAVSDILVQRWQDELFAIVDDGTIYGRELVESFRLAAELTGLQPVFIDTYRPQMENQIGLVARLRRAGATHVLVGGDRVDVAIMGRDAAELGYDLTIASGEALRAARGDVPLAPGTLMVGLPEPGDTAPSDVIKAFESREIIPEGYAIPGYTAFEVAVEALIRAETSGRTIGEVLRAETFETAMGDIAFDEKGDLAENPYRLFRYDGDDFVLVE
ncbi:MAG: branched-chain amino acid ABC transporter substrate-binding protein [Rhizobiaceae bacterium]|nr:branched-chain amino acid ABC transporter substrate-binding protein [Rhizobiaceae bacterium]